MNISALESQPMWITHLGLPNGIVKLPYSRMHAKHCLKDVGQPNSLDKL